MTHLIINDRVASLECQAQALLIRMQDKPPLAIPLRRLDTLVLLHSVDIPSRLISTLQQLGISLVYINTHTLSRSFTIAPPGSTLAIRKRMQLMLLNDRQQQVDMVRFSLEVKFQRMLSVIEECYKSRKEQQRPLFSAKTLVQQCRTGLSEAASLNELRGLEGKAQQGWFRAYQYLLPDSLGFIRRQRRPPRDPVNALLSLTYMRIYLLSWQVALSTGLEPSIGFYHESAPNRQSLACDLMEPLRPLAELFVMRIFNRQRLRSRDFYSCQQGCFLKKEALTQFQSDFEDQCVVWQRLLWVYARKIIQLTDEAEHR
ncbi:CRISPR-associated endonuclease Cas1 [Endozoicomonas montiporae]|uniref:CRISPR-associated endonuclease Cas1 n=1 Tax=Endozoicomonas montiporae CL-33 TaxID=570277 RepID=A0A142BBW6_9GAMM|nr:CRISPR-associated endonuclease Cas1 [Endozoicomonas montiporae]AMO56242.1 CRISPR-associated Cas1 family protein [Endozoicomonas montiporae CL-33]